MANNFSVLKKATRNKVLHYVFSRYATYFIQFINSLLIAVYLGPYYLGIWGFITLIIQYLNQINFGIAHSVNAIISVHKNKEWYVQKVIGTSITMLIGLSIIVGLFLLVYTLFNFDLGNKYNFPIYAPVVALIGILAYFNTLLSNIFRVYGKITEIAINQSAFPVLMLITILLFKKEDLLWALVWANLLAFAISLCLYIFRSPVNLKPIFVRRLIETIQKKGWYLFVYNTSFYLIIISTRSFVSAYYSVKEFGYFTFAFALANVIMLLLQSFSFLIFPKLLNRLAFAATEQVISLLGKVRNAYITTSHLLVHFAILLFPLFLQFFPKYSQSADSFRLVALTIVLYTNSFGYSGLLIAKGGERRLGYISFLSLAINVGSAFILIKEITVSFSFVIIATMFTYLLFGLLLGHAGRKELNLNTSLFKVINDIFPLKLSLPYLVSLSLIILDTNNYFFLIPTFLFLLLNYKPLLSVRKLGKLLIENPNLINI